MMSVRVRRGEHITSHTADQKGIKTNCGLISGGKESASENDKKAKVSEREREREKESAQANSNNSASFTAAH